MAIASDKTKEYLQMLEEKFDINNFYKFIKDLLNLESSNIVNGQKLKATSEQYKNYIDTTQLYAKYQDNKRRTIGVLVIKLQDNKLPANARTLQRNYIAHLLDNYGLDASLTAIYSETDDTWRLSFVKQELDFGGGKIKAKFTPAKRYSYLFGKDEPNHTAKEQLLELLENNNKLYSIEEIEDKFSVEKVTKDFFENYKENYLKLKETLEANDEFVSESNRCDFTSEEFTKKLMGQIVFIYFLQKKGWLGVRLVPQLLSLEEYNNIYSKCDVIQKKILDKYYITFNGNKKIKKELLEKYNDNKQEIESLSDIFANTDYDNKWGSGQKRFIRAIFDNCKNRKKNFFDDYLEPFFYDGLNHKRKNQYFSLFNCKIPFLNGGLFEPLDNYQWEIARFNIDNEIFSNKEETGILDFFDRYNFTMNEEEPLEKDVAVDPEMLGKIFENLLDVKDRKSKGAFYTPREIVHYMCQESIANFLVNKVGVKYEEIKEFIQYGEMIRDADLKEATKDSYLIGESIFKNIIQIDNALENIKIADPAVGSGAFPLGILNEIVKMRDILTSYMLIYNRLGLFGKIYSEEQITNNKRSIYNMKWNTIKNSIYAVDIENSAVDITKLRLWLSIVVDQVDDPEPLPNLNCKIMQGNSLVDEFEGIKLIDKKFIDELKDRENVKFNASNGIIKDLKGRKQYISGNQIEFGDGQKKVQIDDLIRLKQELYGENEPNRKKSLLEKIETARNELLRLNFLGTNKEKELLEIDKSHNKPYFAWMLEFIEVFIENDGFDIVIGNPPYVGQKGNKEIFQEIKATQFGKKFHQRRMDLFYFFFHKGIDIAKNNGNISYITTNYFLTSTYADKLRNDIYSRTNIIRLINFNEIKIFETALGQHNLITMLEKDVNKEKNTKAKTITPKSHSTTINEMLEGKDDKTIIYTLSQKNIYEPNSLYIRMEGISNNTNNLDNNVLGKMELSENKLIEICDINTGIQSGCDKVTQKYIDTYKIDAKKGEGIFVLSKDEVDSMILNEEEQDILKPFFKNSDIHRWNTEENTDEKIIYYTSKENYHNVENIKNYLSKYKIILINRNIRGSKITIQEYDDYVEKDINNKNISYIMIASAMKEGNYYCISYARDKRNFIAPKIVCPQRSMKNTFAYNEIPWYASADVYFINLKENESKYSLKYILGLLNSKLYYFWLYNKGKRKGEMLELFLTPLSEIPIKYSELYFRDLEETVELLLTKKNNTDELEEKIDDLVYKIYNLTDDEIKLVKDFYNSRGV